MVFPEVMMCRREPFADSSALYTADWNTERTSKGLRETRINLTLIGVAL